MSQSEQASALVLSCGASQDYKTRLRKNPRESSISLSRTAVLSLEASVQRDARFGGVACADFRVYSLLFAFDEQFSTLPVGPIGASVQLKEDFKQFRVCIEAHISRHLGSFIVSNPQ